MADMSDAYPRDCPVCGEAQPRASAFDLHMHRNHSDDEAGAAVAGAIVDELEAMTADGGAGGER